jgi:hypothetical protein
MPTMGFEPIIPASKWPLGSAFNIVRIIQSKQDIQCMEQATFILSNHKTTMKIILN